MVTNTIPAAKTIAKPLLNQSNSNTFKSIMKEKQNIQKPHEIGAKNNTEKFSIKNSVSEVITNHEQAAKSIKTFLTRTDYTPDKLLAIQYKTGILFLREQMFSKTAELSANTLKSFIQMQV